MYLGIDLGTSGVKALLMDEGGAVAGQAEAALSVSRPAPLRSEQNPADWIAAAGAAVGALRARDPKALAAVEGIGLSGQMHGAVALDAAHAVLRPAILWNDGRSHAEAAAMDADPRFRNVTGNIVFPGFTAPKLAWMRAHEPALFERVAMVLLPKDMLRLWLTGETVGEMSDAAGTAWLDMAARDWSDDLLAATGLSRAQMPRLVEGSAVSGGLRTELAQAWGMRAGLPVAGGAGDNAATAVGLGVAAEGEGFVSLGTSGVLFAATAAFRPDAASAVHAFCHALPGTWHQMGVILSAAAALDWFAGIAGSSGATLTEELGEDLRAPSGVLFAPYLAGERTPHNDPHLTAGFRGLTGASDRTALTHAVLEGVAFALRDTLAALEAAGTRVEALIAAGGGSRSAYWLRMIATVLGLPVLVPGSGEAGAALGAARLGRMAATGETGPDAMPRPAIAATIAPEAALTDAFAAQYMRFRAMQGDVAGHSRA